MEDIITKYKKQRKARTIWIIVTSLLLAISLNVFLSTSDMWKTLKSSVLESSTTKSDLSDLYLISDNNILTLKASKEMKEVKSVSFSFLYNGENVELKDKLLWDYNWSIIEISVEKWQYTLTLAFDKPTNILVRDWEQSKPYQIMRDYLNPNVFIWESSMTEDEKEKYPIKGSYFI